MARIIDAFTQFLDDSGDPLVDGWLRFTESGTNNTDKNTFADINEKIANANPVQLDGSGRAPNIFGTGTYNVRSFQDDNGVPGTQLQAFDPVGGNLEGTAFSDWSASTIYSIGDIVRGSDGNDYQSITNNNQNNNPTSPSPTNWEELQLGRIWNTNVTYALGDSVYGSDGYLYRSKVASNLGNDPISTGEWEAGVNLASTASRGFIDGLITSNGTDADHDIDTAVGSCMDSTGATLITLSAVLTKQIDANWSAGTNAGGFPSGLTLTADTWYHFFAIAKTDGSVDFGWDTSLSATNLLADATGFTLFRIIASHLTDSVSNIIDFSQKGDEFLFTTPVSDIVLSNPGISAVLATMQSPLGIKAYPITSYVIVDGSPVANNEVIITSPDQADTVPSGTLFDIRALSVGGGGAPGVSKLVRTDTSSQIRFRISNSDSGVSFRATTFGFIHPRGKE